MVGSILDHHKDGIKRLIEEGQSCTEIVKHLEGLKVFVNYNTLYAWMGKRKLKAADGRAASKSSKYTHIAERNAKIIALRIEGVSAAELASRYSLSRTSVYRILKHGRSSGHDLKL